MKKILVVLLCVLLLCGCTPSNNEQSETVIYDFPEINCPEEKLEENMLTYAGFLAVQWLTVYRFNVKIENINIGDKVCVYTIDENGKPVIKGNPFYYPLIENNKIVGYVAIQNNVVFVYDDNNIPIGTTGIPYSFTTCDIEDEWIQLTKDQLYGNVDYTSAYDRLITDDSSFPSKFAVYFTENEQLDVIVVTEKDTILYRNYSSETKQAKIEDDENTSWIREQLSNQQEYQIHPLKDYATFTPTEVHIVENTLSNKDEQERISKLKSVFKSTGLKTDGKPLNIWRMYVNTDLSVTVCKFVQSSYYALFENKEFVGLGVAYKKNDEITAMMALSNGLDILAPEKWQEINQDADNFLILIDPITSIHPWSKSYITEDSLIPSIDGNANPLHVYITDMMREYIGK